MIKVPLRVTISDLTILATDQANATIIIENNFTLPSILKTKLSGLSW